MSKRVASGYMGKIKALPGALITVLPLMTVIISAAVVSWSDMQVIKGK